MLVMANPEHVKILKQGVQAWNAWRREHPDIRPDLVGADLNGSDLKVVDLSGANLREADLREANLWVAELSKADLGGAYISGADLWVADLSRADLGGAHIRGSNLRVADLRGANLQEADFREAYLRKADLRGTDLNRVFLKGADLRSADFSGANLSGANLREAILNEASLIGTNLREIFVGSTSFGNLELSGAIGLETINHRFPSTIGLDTIKKSKGKIPEVFLRGCGLSDIEIEFAKLANPDLPGDQLTKIVYKIHDLYLGGSSIQYYSLFISYSSHDEEFAEKIHNDLQDNGIRCWFAPHDIQAGKKIYHQIDEAIRIHDRLLLILSEHSMQSEWVKTEIAEALAKEIDQKRKVLFPISIVDFAKIKKWKCFDADRGKDSAREIREYYIPDFSNWRDEKSYQEAFNRLLRDLKATGSK